MSEPAYPPLSRLLHRLALGSRWIARASFDLEQLVLRPRPLADDRHVFVCGLARAGTTILMHLLYETGAFATLTYRHMPFVLMPGLWQRLSAHQREAASLRERPHGDGIVIGYDTAEAFEEVFWTTHCPEDYIFTDHLAAHEPDPHEMALFRQFLGSVIASSGVPGQRYLSKNNNNLLRLPSLQRHLPGALFLIAFRDPLQHAASLLDQHRRFSAMQQQDSFVRDYMKWLGHFEFGLDHLAFYQPINDGSPDGLDYWLQSWIQVYERVLALQGPDIVLIGYEDLCLRSEALLRTLWTRIGVEMKTSQIELKASSPKAVTASAPLVQRAEEIFRELTRRSLINC